MYAIHAGKAALNAHYKRIGWNARAQEGAVDGWYQTKFTLKEEPLVSILIPNKDHTDDLDVCLNSFLSVLTIKIMSYVRLSIDRCTATYV